MQTRRNWLKAALTATASLPLGVSMADTLMRSPVSETERRVFQNNFSAPLKLRLDSNENPYGPSESAKQAVIRILGEGNRYPFDALKEFKEILAAKEGVTSDHIAVGAGSGDLLCATGAAFGLEGGSLLSAYPTFPLLMNYADVFKTKWDKVDLNDKLEYDYQVLASRVTKDTKLVFICNPNNPTGTLVDSKIVKSFCEEVSQKVTVFADEAYLEFLDQPQQISMVDLVRQGKNIIVSRTFSKIYGLAGLRIGYIIAKPDLIKKISKYQMGIPVSQTAIAAAKASLIDRPFRDVSRTKNGTARQILTAYLDSKKLFYGKSHTNFVFFDPNADGYSIMNKLTEQGIGIRVWDYKEKSWCRVSIGTLDEMMLFVKELDKVLV
jgi:histidinol-phosphate aminotransferase